MSNKNEDGFTEEDLLEDFNGVTDEIDKVKNEWHDKIDKVKEWGFDIRLDVNLDELMYYMIQCNGHQFKTDLFDEDEFVDEYVTGKFFEFQDRFPHFLHSLSDKYKTRFCVAVHNFYMNNHKDKTDEK